MIAVVDPPLPAEYLPSGDRALLLAWTAEGAVLVLEDGTIRRAPDDAIKIDYRYDHATSDWLDVSRVHGLTFDDSEGTDADSDQEAGDDGSEEIPGHVPEPD